MSLQERRVLAGRWDSLLRWFQPGSVNHLFEGKGQEPELNLLLSLKPEGETFQDRDIKEQTFKSRTSSLRRNGNTEQEETTGSLVTAWLTHFDQFG